MYESGKQDPVRSHQINFMDDGFSAGKMGRASRFFLFSKNRFPTKNGASKEAIFFQKKKRSTDVIFRLRKKNSIQTKIEWRKNLLVLPKKSGEIIFFF